MKKLVLELKENTCIARDIYKMDLLCKASDFDLKEINPGQFLHIRCGGDTLLRRPISICDLDYQKEIITILYRVEGKGTKLLSEMLPGEMVDCLGPLGNGFPQDSLKEGDTALIIGGGIGVPPVYLHAKELAKKGIKVKAVIGFNSKDDVFLEKEFAELGEVEVATMDGSHGHKGLLTELIDKNNPACKFPDWDALYTCGPTPMLKALQSLFEDDERASFMSLEERMGCGIGACLACVCHPKEGFDLSQALNTWEKSYKRSCCEGPVFKLQEVALGG